MRLASLSFMPGFGFAQTTASLTGQHLGAKDPDSAERMIWVGTFYCGVLMAAICILYFTLADPLLMLFTTSEEIFKDSIIPLKIYAALAIFLAPAMVARGGINGAGDTAYTLKIMLISRFVIRLHKSRSMERERNLISPIPDNSSCP
ncbi:MAG TPA: hypothetical protein DCO79_13260 [Spirochaeta sp.]|nr:hypothetical protein [Spirochaeta sp.]